MLGTAEEGKLGGPHDKSALYKARVAAGLRDASPGGGSPRPAMCQPKDGKSTVRGDAVGGVLFEDDSVGTTSIFDPVLCELVYRWFCPPNSAILDPFAGGSVRGIVAGELGHHYTGIDISAPQIDANMVQARVIGTQPLPKWIIGDSRDELASELCGTSPRFNLIFSCPPYGNLEQYSDDPRDLSAMSVADFQESYFDIIAKACALLVPNSFACFVVGDYSDKKTGYYQNLPELTVAAFGEAGLHKYNEMIIVNVIGSLPLRINNQFNGSRKIGKTHQNCLVFANADPRDFVSNWPPLEMEGFDK